MNCFEPVRRARHLRNGIPCSVCFFFFWLICDWIFRQFKSQSHQFKHSTFWGETCKSNMPNLQSFNRFLIDYDVGTFVLNFNILNRPWFIVFRKWCHKLIFTRSFLSHYRIAREHKSERACSIWVLVRKTSWNWKKKRKRICGLKWICVFYELNGF